MFCLLRYPDECQFAVAGDCLRSAVFQPDLVVTAPHSFVLPVQVLLEQKSPFGKQNVLTLCPMCFSITSLLLMISLLRISSWRVFVQAHMMTGVAANFHET